MEKMEALARLSARIVSFTKTVQTQCRRLEIHVSQMLHAGRQVADDILLECMNGCSLNWEKTHADLADLQSSGGDTFGLLQAEQLIQCATILEEVNAVLLTTVLRDIHYGAEEEVAMKVQLALSRQILHSMPVMNVQ